MYLVALLEAAEDGNGVLHRRFVGEHRLEAALQGGVLLDVLAVFVQGGRADGAQLAARQRRLEQVGGIHRPLGGAGSHQGVKLVHEQENLPFGGDDLVDHRLEPLLELAAKLGAGHQRAKVQGQHLFVAQRVGHVAGHDAPCQPLHDGGLAHARIADQDRVVLGAPRQHLHEAANLVVAADHRIQLLLARQRSQIAAVALQYLVLALGILVGNVLPAAQLAQRPEHAVARHPRLAQDGRAGTGGGQERQQQVLGAGVLVVEPVGLSFSGLQYLRQLRRDRRLAAIAVLLWLGVQCRLQVCGEVGLRPRGALQQRPHHAVALLPQREAADAPVRCARGGGLGPRRPPPAALPAPCA